VIELFAVITYTFTSLRIKGDEINTPLKTKAPEKHNPSGRKSPLRPDKEVSPPLRDGNADDSSRKRGILDN